VKQEYLLIFVETQDKKKTYVEDERIALISQINFRPALRRRNPF